LGYTVEPTRDRNEVALVRGGRGAAPSQKRQVEDLLSAFHVLHYIVQLSENLSSDKQLPQGAGPDDMWRHMLMQPIIELYEALTPYESARKTRILMGFALHRVALAFNDSQPRGRSDPLVGLFGIAAGIHKRGLNGDDEEARFLVKVAAAIKRDTRQLGIISFPTKMPKTLYEEWDDFRQLSHDRSPLPWNQSPWLSEEGFRDTLAQRRSGLGRPVLRPIGGAV
jgi:hypothetical protein